MSTQGWAAPGVRELAEKSRALLPRSTSIEHTVSTLFGLYMHYHVASARAASLTVAEGVQFADRIDDPSLKGVAATAMANHLHAEGRFLDAETWLEKACALYNPARDQQQGAVYGMDCRVWATALLAWVQFAIGRTTRAFTLADEAIAWARQIRHVPSLGIALLYLSQIHQMNGDKAGVRERTGELLAASKTYGLPAFEGYGATLASWAAGDLAGVQMIIGILKSINCNLILTYYGSFLADIEAERGNVNQAIAHLDTYLAMSVEHGEHAFEPELLRRRARCEMRLPQPDASLARKSLEKAHDLARQGGMYRFEAAAIQDHLHLLGDDEALRERLRLIHDSFPDLKRLKAQE